MEKEDLTMRCTHPGWQVDVGSLPDTPPWDWPNGTGALFKKLLRNRQAKESDRLIAAQLGGNLVVIDDELALALLAVVGSASESEEMRSKAAISLGPVLDQTDTGGFDDSDPEDVPIGPEAFRTIQRSLRNLYQDADLPKEVSRRILEASVRAPEDWHRDAIARAYSSNDRDWMLTAVFSMCRVRGFDEQILDALKSPDPEIRCEAVDAAGTWELHAAWPSVLALIDDKTTPKPLLLRAIDAAGSIRPGDAVENLHRFTRSKDPDIAEAAQEAIVLASHFPDEDDEEDEKEDEWLN